MKRGPQLCPTCSGKKTISVYVPASIGESNIKAIDCPACEGTGLNYSMECVNCKFSKRFMSTANPIEGVQGHLHCHRNPPTRSSCDGMAEWPIVRDEQYCGEFYLKMEVF